MAFADPLLAIDVAHLAIACEMGVIGAQAHGAAQIAALVAPLDDVAPHPFRHETDHGVFAGAEFRRARAGDTGQVASRLDHCHLHAEADAEIGHVALAGETCGMDLAFCPAFAEAARHQDSMDALEVLDAILALEDFRIDPVQPHPHIVGDAAMG